MALPDTASTLQTQHPPNSQRRRSPVVGVLKAFQLPKHVLGHDQGDFLGGPRNLLNPGYSPWSVAHLDHHTGPPGSDHFELQLAAGHGDPKASGRGGAITRHLKQKGRRLWLKAARSNETNRHPTCFFEVCVLVFCSFWGGSSTLGH